MPGDKAGRQRGAENVVTWETFKPILYNLAVAILGALFGVGGTVGAQKLTSEPPKPAQTVSVAPAPTPPVCDLASLRASLGEINDHALKAHGYSQAAWDRLQLIGADHRNNRIPKRTEPSPTNAVR